MSNVLRTTELLKLLKRNIATLQHNLLSKNVPFAGRNSLCMTSNYYLVCTKAREMTATFCIYNRDIRFPYMDLQNKLLIHLLGVFSAWNTSDMLYL